MSAKYFHVNTAEALIIGDSTYKKGASYRIKRDDEAFLFSLADDGVVTLTDKIVSFASIAASKVSESSKFSPAPVVQEEDTIVTSERSDELLEEDKETQKSLSEPPMGARKKSKKAISQREELP